MKRIAKVLSFDHHYTKRHLASNKTLKSSHTIHSNPQVFDMLRKPVCPCDGGCPRCIGIIQPKLTVGQPNDIYEQEADRMTDMVMRMPGPEMQRPIEPEEEKEEYLQAEPLADKITPLVQKHVELEAETEEDDEEFLQGKKISSQTNEVNSDIESRINALKGGGQPLSESTRNFFKLHFGYNFSSVRIHNDSGAASLASIINAKAFTFRKNVIFGSGQYQPKSAEGMNLLAHELTHVVQQESVEDSRRSSANKDICRKQKGDDVNTSHTVTRYLNPNVKSLSTNKLLIGNFGIRWYAPHNIIRQKLISHELVHTIRKCPRITKHQVLSHPPIIDKFENFCIPYKTDIEARAWHRIMIIFFIPAITYGVLPENLPTKMAPPEFVGLLQLLKKGFGKEVGSLWSMYLNPRTSSIRIVFSDPSSEIVKGFINSKTTIDRQKELVNEIKKRIRCFRLKPNALTKKAVEHLLPKNVLKYPIDFNHFDEIPGNIAGGVSGSKFGADERKVSGTVGFFRKVDETGNTIDVQMRTNFEFVVRDTIDFCDGNPGWGLEQNLTLPLSRLEKSGLASAVPFEVRYQGIPIKTSLDLSLVNRCWRRRRTRHRRKKD